MRVLITGATGFVGQTLLSTLSQRSVRVAVRAPEGKFEHCEVAVIGEISGQTQWQSALEGIDCVVHMAARVHVMHPTSDDDRLFHEVNVLGTEQLASMAAKSGVKRFVFLSSIKVNGEATFGRPYTATDIGAPVDAYGVSKYQAEQRLFAIAQMTGMEVVVIRPPLVYGPGVRANFLRLLSWVHKGVPLPLGSIRNARSLVSVWNLCDLIRCVIEAPSITSGVMMVSDGVDLSTPDLIRRMAAALGRAPHLVPVPVALLQLAGAITGRKAEVMRLCGSLAVDLSETKRRLGWTPPLSIDESLARTARWYLGEDTTCGS